MKKVHLHVRGSIKTTKMLLKYNILEILMLFSLSGCTICLLMHYVTDISPFSGFWFVSYIIITISFSLTLSIRLFRWLLRLNAPIKSDFEQVFILYPQLRWLSIHFPKIKSLKQHKTEEYREYDTNELSVISTVLEKNLVSSWYLPYISEEIGFPFASKQMLDHMIGKLFQIVNHIDPKDVFIDTCTIFVSHLREYKKALRRHEKTPAKSIEELYKKTHAASDPSKKYSSADHCTNILRVVIKQLIPWELWETPHCEMLVRILSKKLDEHIENTVSDPNWLLHQLMSYLSDQKEDVERNMEHKENCVPEEAVEYEQIREKNNLMETNKPETLEVRNTLETVLSAITVQSTAPILQSTCGDLDDDKSIFFNGNINMSSEQLRDEDAGDDLEPAVVLRERKGRRGLNEVKIYDRIIEGAVSTWENEVDLKCVSLGQDLLASLDGELTLSRLWDQDTEDNSSPKPESKSPQHKGEEELNTYAKEKNHSSPHRKELSPKPADVLLKDLQTTVSQAKNKIGDLQDEAAGMMEGLLDFGIAGLKKGLRLTGLSDDSAESSALQMEKCGEGRTPPHTRLRAPIQENANPPVLDKDENPKNPECSLPHLVKQQRISSQDGAINVNPLLRNPEDYTQSDSPEPEYEETPDLSTSIAKLRSLLLQRSDTSPNKNEEIWWESAEETKGRTHTRPLSRPVDTALFADEYETNLDRGYSPEPPSNNMQRLDKLFQRTVTGVFNSIKTAVGGEEDDVTSPLPLQKWSYVCTPVELSVGMAVARIVASKRAYTQVDAALDSLEQLATPVSPPKDDVVEDFDDYCAIATPCWCACAEVACAAGLWESHVVHRLITTLVAEFAESLITSWLNELTRWLRVQVFAVFKQISTEHGEGAFTTDGDKTSRVRAWDQDEACQAIMKLIPNQHVFGDAEVRRAVTLCISSLGHARVNRDFALRLVDAWSARIAAAAQLRNPPFDVN